MTRGFLFAQHRFIIVSILILMAAAALSGCGSPDSSKPVICTPTPSNVNIYKTAPQTWTNMLFEFAATPVAIPSMPVSSVLIPVTGDTPIPSPGDQQILGARYGAFQYLIDETKNWSDIETIKLDDSSEAQIIVTFISPELLQAVFLGEVLRHRLFISDFKTQTEAMLDSVAAREEMIFLLTITTTNNGRADTPVHTIKIPINQMALINGEDLKVVPKHDDHILNQPINSSFKPVSGYLAYPFAVLTNSECKWALEPKYNTSIVITVPTLQIDGVASGPYTWTIPYSSLMHANIPPTPPMPVMPPMFDSNLMSPLEQPPNGNINQTNNWQDFARFVWYQMLLGNY